MTSGALYNIEDSMFMGISIKRKIPLKAVQGITSSLKTNEFVIHVKGLD